MKKIITSFSILGLSLIFINHTQAQAFQKGNINIDIGIGFGIYGTQQKTTSNLSFEVGGTPFSQTNVNDTTDGAVSRIIPISFEYGISDKIGLGLDLTSSNYYIDEDDRKYTRSVKGFDFGLKANYHLLNADKNDLFIGIGLGVSSMNWEFENDVTNVFGLSSASGSGLYFSLGITDRIFFSDHVGILFNLGYRGYSYPEIRYDVKDATSTLAALGVTNIKFSQTSDWKLNGVHIGTGLAIKF